MSIHFCIERGSVEEVRAYFQERTTAFNVVPPLPGSNLPVHLAISFGRLDLIEVLHDINKKWIDLVSAEGHTPLSLAARHDDLAAVKLLIRLGCASHKRDTISPVPVTRGAYPIEYAVRSGNNDIIRELAAWDPRQLELRSDYITLNMGLVCMAAMHGRRSTIELLVELCGLDKFLSNGHNPITAASGYGRRHCLPLLFRLGFSIDRPKEKYNAIHYNASGADARTLEYLVDQGGRGQETEVPIPTLPIHSSSETVVTLVRLGFRNFKKDYLTTMLVTREKLTLSTLFVLLPEYLHYYEGDDKDYYRRCFEDEDFCARTRSAAYFTEPLVVRCLRENHCSTKEN